MKICPKCGKEFGDIDNYCMFCGVKLKPKEESHQRQVSDMQKRLEALEFKIKSSPPSDHAKEIGRIKSKVVNLEQKMNSASSSFQGSLKEIDKKAERLGQLTSMDKEEAASLVNEINTMEKKIGELNDSISSLRLEIPQTEHILSEIEQRIAETKGVSFTQNQHQLEEMRRRLETMESRIQGSEQEMEEEIEKIRKESKSADLSRFMNVIESNRSKIEELEKMKADLDIIKKRSASFDAQEIKNTILDEFERINSKLVESVEKKKEEIQKIEQETAKMREGIESLKNLEDKVKGVDADNISRDLEILKTKTKWLEEQVEGLDIKPIHSRLKELEAELRKITVRSPLIVE